ncbi:hypothetical protein [Ruegeria sp. Ofav3-42]|uniref:hypothetical protein n=1 Tax=Ruegeria sp. Ofav3-42 TaxID=2917759 RepID=UPI001EF43CFA|nr:hypothetical protein [Ruegeria sp. Ofav3-42]MCG7520098.1 hypothetical protein [Ruegeria sp. Ofav3-42]
MARTTECFFVTPIGAAGSKERNRADSVLNYVLRPISKGFLNIVRADEVDEPGTITTDIVQRLYNNPLVIADLTGQNPNVMYEVGLRHCFNLPIVHIAQDGEKPPFDLAAERIIFFDINDLASVDEGKKRILSACKAALDAKPFKSPVVRALEKETLFAGISENRKKIEITDRLEILDRKIENLAYEIQTNIYSEMSDAVSQMIPDFDDSHLLNRLDELVRLFDQVGPSDIATLAKAAKSVSKQYRE